MKKGLVCLLCIGLALCALHGCKTSNAAATHQLAGGTAIADQIRARLAEAGLPPVRVFVLEGRVTLSGSVPSQEIREKMIATAKAVKGVSQVSDDLQLQRIR